MKTVKKTYQDPHIQRVDLDSEISLNLQSSGSPMGDPEANNVSGTPSVLSTSFNPGNTLA
jgi:hypothetical protein